MPSMTSAWLERWCSRCSSPEEEAQRDGFGGFDPRWGAPAPSAAIPYDGRCGLIAPWGARPSVTPAARNWRCVAHQHTIQELAGHMDLSMTQRDVHLRPAALDSAILLLEQPARAAHAVQTLETWGRRAYGRTNEQ